MTQETADDDLLGGGEGRDSVQAGAEEPGSGDDAGDAQSAIRALTGERDELRDLLIRKQAEFENFRKRTERERAEFVQFALADCLKEVLNVLDSFDLALRDAPGREDEDEASLAVHRGYELIYKQLLESLQRFGLETIEAVGKEFDPHVHQAVSTQPGSGAPEGTVLQDLRKGYLLKGKLLRPAMVVVAAPPDSQEGESAS